MNGLSMNGLSMNGLSMNGLGSVNGLSSTSGLMTTSGGRDIVKYIVRCAFPAGHSLVKKDQNNVSYTFPGAIGVAPELEGTGLCSPDCQERVSACMLAHVNNAGAHISLWLTGEGAIGWAKDTTNYPYEEGSFFGNLFPNPWNGYYCTGKDLDVGSVPGRLGTPIATNVYSDPFGSNVGCADYCTAHSGADGYSSCATQSGGYRLWKHVVTVYRNFDADTKYKICDYGTGSGKCLGVVGSSTSDGAKVEIRSYSGTNSQKWQVLQVSAGKYKLVNVNSGKALDNDTTSPPKTIQKTYSGTSSQLIAIKVLSNNQAGRFNLIPSSGTNGLNVPNLNDGAVVQLDSNLTADSAKWTILPVQ
jgi:hypothetical protein